MGQVTVDTFRIALIRATDSLGGTGLRFAPVLHSGNQNESCPAAGSHMGTKATASRCLSEATTVAPMALGQVRQA